MEGWMEGGGKGEGEGEWEGRMEGQGRREGGREGGRERERKQADYVLCMCDQVMLMLPAPSLSPEHIQWQHRHALLFCPIVIVC